MKELAELAGLDRKGVTLAGLVKAANSKGLTASAWSSTLSQLQQTAGPAILDWPEGHFVVLVRWEVGAAVLFDPPSGLRTVGTNQLAARWGGHLLTFTRR